jgi:ectoine hydroxylase-related dioxygenase (phytanoyl-CoA dioxygenase family)
MLKPIFKSELEQATFEKDGYVVVRKLIPPSVVKELRAMYIKYEKEHYIDHHGMSNSSHISNAEVLLDIYQQMKLLVTEYADRHLINYNFFAGGFLVKKSGEDSFFDMHQDRTLVEEPQYCSLNFWISLDDIVKNHGRLFVLKGTPRLDPYIRTAPEYSMKWNQIKKTAPLFYTYLDTEAGDVVLFNHALFHGSEKNRSGRSRMAAAMGVYSSDTPLSIYYKDANTPPNKARALSHQYPNFNKL